MGVEAWTLQKKVFNGLGDVPVPGAVRIRGQVRWYSFCFVLFKLSADTFGSVKFGSIKSGLVKFFL